MDLLSKGKPSFNIKITVINVYYILCSIFGVNLIFLGGTWLSKSGILANASFSTQFIVVQFNLLEENVTASWYSSMLYFITGIIAFFCYLIDSQKAKNWSDKSLNTFWLVVASIFFLLSFDEMGTFHEVIGAASFMKKLGEGDNTGWFVFHTSSTVVGVLLSIFIFLKFKQYPFLLAINLLAVLLLLSSPLQEQFELNLWRSSLNQETWKRPLILIIIEKGTETFASFFFLYTFVMYLKKKTKIMYMGKATLSMDFTFIKYFPIYLIALLIALGVLMLLTFYFPWNVSGRSYFGLPQNWFPAIVSIYCSFISLYFEISFKKKLGFLRSIYLVLAVLSILSSAYFGSNLYYYRATQLDQIRLLILGANLVLGIILIIEFNGSTIKKFLSAWLIIFIISLLFPPGFYTTFLAYIAYACLLIALYLHFQRLLYLRDNYE